MAQDKAYFQQKVDYKIEVELDDVNHFLTGNIEMKYTLIIQLTLCLICIFIYGLMDIKANKPPLQNNY